MSVTVGVYVVDDGVTASVSVTVGVGGDDDDAGC